MSIEAMNWALQQRTGNPNAKSVLFILANRANHDGRCYPGIDGIAEQLEVSRRTVIRQIKALEKIGLISIVRRGGDGQGRKSNLYQLHVEAKCQSVTLGQCDNGAGQCDTHDRQCDTVTPESKEGTESKNPKRDAREGLNEKAWNDYLEHRREIRAKKLTERGAAIHIRNLCKLSPEDQQAVVDQTISNGWTGLFPEKLSRSHSGADDSYYAELRQAIP